MQYMASRQKATEWSVTKRIMVNYWCANGQIEGAYKEGSRWWIPVDVERSLERGGLRRMRRTPFGLQARRALRLAFRILRR